MYSLFKQATVGNVKSPRPGIWDMLGRAKWDAWAKNKDLDPYEARWLYVEALLKVLRKYSDKTVAMSFVQELESYSGDPLTIVMSRNLTRSPRSDSSGSTVSDATSPFHPSMTLTQRQKPPSQEDGDESTSEQESTSDVNAGRRHSETRPRSSLSSQRYRTPMAGSLVMSPTPSEHHVPLQQPLPGFETPSAYAEPTSFPSSLYPPSNSFPGPLSESSRPELVPPSHLFAGHQSHRTQVPPHHPSQFELVRPPSPVALERAVENVQVHLAALTERLETLESRSLLVSRSNISPSSRGSPPRISGRGSPTDRNGIPKWDLDDLGMWSFVLNPLSHVVDTLQDLSTFFSRDENRSPSLIIIRRLCLDVSFLLCVIGVIGAIWRKSGNRRREVRAALVVLWRAIVGSPTVDRGV